MITPRSIVSIAAFAALTVPLLILSAAEIAVHRGWKWLVHFLRTCRPRLSLRTQCTSDLFQHIHPPTIHHFNAAEWTAIPTRLNEAGFAVSYCRITSATENSLWNANAQRGENEWNAVGSDLESALVALQKQTQKIIPDWQEMKKVA